MQKIIAVFDDLDTMIAMMSKYTFRDCLFTHLGDGRVQAVVYPYQHSLRREMGAEVGVSILPGMHDPAPIGDVHQHFTHAGAQPHHTAREVALRLHDLHGDQFHPDT